MTPPCLNCSNFPGALSPNASRGPIFCNVSEIKGIFHPEDLNLTDKALKLKYLGPQQIEQFWPICVMYLLIFVVGTLGNGLTCTVILRHKTMHTPTNFYLFSLAVSDLLVLLVGLPLELYEMRHNYPFQLDASACHFRILLFETVCLASVLNVTALSVERYVAVVRPLQAKSVMTRAHVRRMLGAIWVLAILFSLPNTSLHGLEQLYVPCRGLVSDSVTCTLVRPLVFYKLVVQITALLFFCLPMVTISVLYLLIGLRLRRERMLLQEEVKDRKTTTARKNSHRRIQLRDRGQGQVIKMLIALVVVFGICWAPFHADRVMWSLVSPHWTDGLHQAYQFVHIASGIFLYLGSAANPVLYSLMSSRFRETFRQALGLGTQCCHGHQSCHGFHNHIRLTTSSTLCDVGPRNSRNEPLAENEEPGCQQETDPS
uniref:neuromedin-U receptor 1 n=1 Tax=Arvicanthis niloticus TaxID=61156 RepID=UPI001486D175|nr:neuromedin-U receptor 1 [Arvicanthis niloticus]